jgi:hypothetical protein
VAFGNEHLYILGTATVESHQMYGSDIASNPDGVVTLLRADGSAAQVGASGNGLLAVVDVNGPASHLSIFNLDEDGNLMLRVSSSVSHPVNGVAIVSSEERD